MNKISIAIIGTGHEGISFYNCFKHKPNVKIVAMATLTDECVDFDESTLKDIILSNSLEEITSLSNLDIIIDTTKDARISKMIHSLKRPGVQVIESLTLELMIALKDKRNSLEAKLLSLLGNVTDGILIVDKEGIITYTNDVFQNITGFSEDELIGCNIVDRFADSPVIKALKLKETVVGKQRLFDDLQEEFSYTITPTIIGNQFSGVIGVFKKIPELIRLMKELQRSSTIIEEIYEKIDFINGAPDVDVGDSDIVPIDRMEQLLLKQALTRYGFTVEGKKRAAKALNISLATLYNKLKKYQIS